MIMRLGFSVLVCSIMGCLILSAVVNGEPPAAPRTGMDELEFFLPGKIQWQPGPPSVPPGARMAILEGDPSKEGPFVFRLKLPDGYRVPPHTHPKMERVTVLAGTLHIGMGAKFDEKAAQAMSAGSYGHWSAGMKHFGWVQGETVLQFHGQGPWSIQYVNPVDDPRNQKK
jgi:hypothetical protein